MSTHEAWTGGTTEHAAAVSVLNELRRSVGLPVLLGAPYRIDRAAWREETDLLLVMRRRLVRSVGCDMCEEAA